jgi:hypothetical protein
MTELIGLAHVPENWERLKTYLDNRYIRINSLMLEVPPNWRKLVDQDYARERFFCPLAELYEWRGTRIIAGDRNRHVIEPEMPDEFFELEKRIRLGLEPNTLKRLKAKFKLRGNYFKYATKIDFNLMSPSKSAKRNEGFLEAVIEESPEVIIVGDAHAQYIKAQRPDIHYTYFRTNSQSLKYNWIMLMNQTAWRKVPYDQLQIYPSF